MNGLTVVISSSTWIRRGNLLKEISRKGFEEEFDSKMKSFPQKKGDLSRDLL